jgi:UDP:flavonoid glycosyltransferase YjiC (YdhE family)
MRVLFTTNHGSGHWHPLIPFAHALEAAGHEVAFAAAPTPGAAIGALGFRYFTVGRDETSEETQERGRT